MSGGKAGASSRSNLTLMQYSDRLQRGAADKKMPATPYHTDVGLVTVIPTFGAAFSTRWDGCGAQERSCSFDYMGALTVVVVGFLFRGECRRGG